MSAGSILIGLLLFAATIPIVIKPLLNHKRPKPAMAGSPKVSSADQHQASLLALRDLEFDHRTGKVTDDDYASLRANLLAQAAATIDAQDKRPVDVDAWIEQAVRGRRKTNVDSLIEEAVRRRRQNQAEVQTANFCPKCGRKARVDDRFCAGCGASLTIHAEVTS